LKTARKLGRRVPEDLAIIGYDNVQDAEYFYPALSTMRQDMIELGRLAVRKLGQVIEAEQNGVASPPEPVVLQPELIVRTSSLLNKH
jgi:LacI family transcriptional regulator